VNHDDPIKQNSAGLLAAGALQPLLVLLAGLWAHCKRGFNPLINLISVQNEHEGWERWDLEPTIFDLGISPRWRPNPRSRGSRPLGDIPSIPRTHLVLSYCTAVSQH
jgi:hypothetical protein